MEKHAVKMWKEQVVIPTYETGKPEEHPMFFEKRVYQGSSGAVYPYPIIDKILDEKADKAYTAIFLENEYIKVMILPALGGRIQMAYDKIGERHFVYYNEVVKPALVGLCGPWISGGIEFNWPQHHRPSTFEPVDFYMQQNDDGSKTVWVSEIERMNHTQGSAGFTLHPGKAYLHIKVKLFNRTPFPQSFLWWANPAVAVNDAYQSVFPPDVHAVYDHGRRDVTDFPIAKGEYYKVDYAPGTDISRYKNIPVPTSYMSVNSAYDFVGGYEHDTGGGILHIADHHISPGKKQWTWGKGDFGLAWDRNLTDSNGPYAELMTGVFTDNQPDFTWMAPHEQKTFDQYFLPYRHLGLMKNASKDVLLHFEVNEDFFDLKVFTTSAMQVKIDVYYHNSICNSFDEDVSPENIFTIRHKVSASATEADFEVIIKDKLSKELLRYKPKKKRADLPLPARAPLQPGDIITNEELYLTGLHLEQYRHATFDPLAYYQEALRRDENDSRSNNAMGLNYLKRGLLRESEIYFKKSVASITHLNSNPKNGEVFYNLGVCLQLQEKYLEAYDAFYKATWNGEWQSNAFFSLAQINIKQGEFESARLHIDQSLKMNAANSKAVLLKVVVLNCLQRSVDATAVCRQGIMDDPFNLPLYFELNLLLSSSGKLAEAHHELQKAIELSRGEAHTIISFAIDYSSAGLYHRAYDWLQCFATLSYLSDGSIFWYYMGWLVVKCGNTLQAESYFAKALAMPFDLHFYNRIQDVEVLQMAIRYNAKDHKALFCLGSLWYDKKQYAVAIDLWQQCIKANELFVPAFRTLGIAYFNKRGNSQIALQHYRTAFKLNSNNARVLMEYDQLRKRLNHSPSDRLNLLEAHLSLVKWRDDLYLERVALYNFMGDYEIANRLIMQHNFHPWEGGEGKVPAQFTFSLIQKAILQIQLGQFDSALSLLQKTQRYPDNLGEGKLLGSPENETFYWMGCACNCLGKKDESTKYFEKATIGSSLPSAAIFYNDPQPDNIFYQALAWRQLGNEDRAISIFNSLVDYGKKHLNDKVVIDYFAVSLPDLLVFDDDLEKRNSIHCLYMTGLGEMGLGKWDDAKTYFDEVSRLEAMHQGARAHTQLIPGFTTKEFIQ